MVIDAGNALFRVMGPATADDTKRARVVLSIMGSVGVRALAVGQRELSAGREFLVEEAEKAKVQLVSTNLEVAGGQAAFPRSLMFDQHGVKVAILATAGVGPVAGASTLTGADPLPAIKAELKKLPKRDVTVLVVTSGYGDAMTLADALSGTIDFVIQSGEYRGSVPPQRIRDVYLLGSGQRGQAIAALTLNLGPGKTYSDLNEASRDKELLENLDSQVAALDGRLKLATDAAAKRDLSALRNQMKTRRDEQAAKVKTALGGKTLKHEWLLLGADIKDDEAIKAKVLEIEPTYAGAH